MRKVWLVSYQESNMKFLVLLFTVQLVQGALERDPKFSLFSVIRFKNDACTAKSNNDLRGSCHTPEECGELGGTQDGNCASGFGTCCVIYQRTCGTVDITRNMTYLVNPSYPSTDADQGQTCTYNVKTDAIKDTICQLRLDFDDVKIVAPLTAVSGSSPIGTCNSDTIGVTSPSGASVPSYCGDISGTHMYVETARQNPAATITMTIGGTTFNRQWRIKVNYIGCWSEMRAPNDCQQYFTGLSGTVMSYGWTAQQVISQNQEYTNCFRQEIGFCQIDFSISQDGTSPDYFSLSGASTGIGALKGAGNCDDASIMLTAAMSVQVDTSNDATNYFCGGHFGVMSGAMTSGVVRSDALPFNIRVVVPSAATLVSTNVGFKINYRQVAC